MDEVTRIVDPIDGGDPRAASRLPIDGISVLNDLPLESVLCDFKPERGAAILRSITTLKTINGKPAAEFWKEFDLRAGAAKPR